jgi:hypothetical protein
LSRAGSAETAPLFIARDIYILTSGSKNYSPDKRDIPYQSFNTSKSLKETNVYFFQLKEINENF